MHCRWVALCAVKKTSLGHEGDKLICHEAVLRTCIMQPQRVKPWSSHARNVFFNRPNDITIILGYTCCRLWMWSILSYVIIATCLYIADLVSFLPCQWTISREKIAWWRHVKTRNYDDLRLSPQHGLSSRYCYCYCCCCCCLIVAGLIKYPRSSNY